MDSTNSTDKPSIDLETGQTNNEEDRPLLFSHNNILRNLFCNDGNVNSTREERIIQEQQLVQTNENEISKRSYNNNKKKACCKPPRPPKGPELDASDVKLIKEISQLAMKKRARVERMKALRKMKEIKSSSYLSSTPSRSSISAFIITILFFLIVIFQGLNSKVGSHHVIFQGSPEPSMAATDSLISVQFFHDPSRNIGNGPDSSSPYTMEQASGSDSASPG
ncbi:uncharacterized protein LOC124929030 [Impatiens glandulifera]|uniref:uncharacterized protein LOC124929030 n=1 Tax=Impatiens glandulifera TaxID=253017 RepID=UPI001FB0DC63|nr:uncharacterized protein LOC124929030 [Impatiens glandulifera]